MKKRKKEPDRHTQIGNKITTMPKRTPNPK